MTATAAEPAARPAASARSTPLGWEIGWQTVAAVIVVIMLMAELWARSIGTHLPPSAVGDPPEMGLKLERMEALGSADTVFIGNSMVDHGINPAVVRQVDPAVGSVYNAALAGAPIVGMTRWSTGFVIPNLHPDTAIVGIHPVSLLDINPVDSLTRGDSAGSAIKVIENSFLDNLNRLKPGPLRRIDDRASDVSSLVKYRTTLRNPVDAWRGTLSALEHKPPPKPLPAIAEDNGVLVARDRAFWKKYLTPVGFASQIGDRPADDVTDPDLMSQFREAAVGSTVNGADMRTLLVALKHRVPHVIVAVMPLAPGVIEAIGPGAARLREARKVLDDMARELHVRVIDLTDAALTPRDFADPVHMNVLGAAIVSKELARQLAA